jgi:uncharacterized protein YybS (DUF2232 family)
LSEFFEKNFPIEKTILYACGMVIAAYIVILLFYANIANTGILALVSEYVARNLALSIELYENMGMPEETILTISNSLEHIQYVLVRIVPALVVALTLFVSWTSILLSRPVLKNRNLFFPDFGPLDQWKAPEFLVWTAIGGGIMFFLPMRAFKMLALNGLIILMVIYFFQGIAVVSFYFEKKQFPRLLRIFLYSIMVMQQFLLLFIVGLGFFDLWLNFRKLGIKEEA